MQQLEHLNDIIFGIFDMEISAVYVRVVFIHDTGYPHDGRADNTAYRHDRREDKRRYQHDREIDIQMLKNV